MVAPSEVMMLGDAYDVVLWDWKEQPNWADIQYALNRYARPVITPLKDTGSADYVVVISSMTLTQAEVNACYIQWLHSQV
jgi:hypothetical protein